MTVRLKRLISAGLLAALLVSIGSARAREPLVGSPEPFKEADLDSFEKRIVVRVVDGDTIVVSPNEKVRLIGVDTPETVHPKKAVECFGKAAKEFTQSAVEGKTIGLVLDEVNKSRRHKDKFGRTLAYVYLEDGTMLNRELIRQGYAHTYTRFRFRYLVEFRELERAARSQSIGLWASCPLN